MSKRRRVFLGVATFWPPVFLFMVFGYQGIMMATGYNVLFLKTMRHWFWLVPLTVIECWGLILYYRRHVSGSALLPAEKKRWRDWILVWSLLAMPIYWYRYIWKQPTR